MYCDHKKQIGDNYGISCQDCGHVLAEFGYGGGFGSNLTGLERCKHGSWYKISDIGKNARTVMKSANEKIK